MTTLPLLTTCIPELPEGERSFGALVARSGSALPLRSLSADITVDDLSTRWRISQEFCNSGPDLIEAVYIFPLPPRAAVSAFRVVLGGRTITGELKERGQARADYQQAIANSQRAALLEEDRPNVFTIQVGNIPPGENVQVHIELAGLLGVEAGEATVRLPLVVAPRYIPGAPIGAQAGSGTAVDSTLVPDASRISPPVLLPGFPNPVKLAICVRLAAAAPITGLHATLPVSEGPVEEGRRTFHLIPGQRLDRDFILRWNLGATEVTCAALGTSQTGSSTIAVTVVPPRADAAGGAGTAAGVRPRDVVVVIDRSGSMEGWKMVAARRAAARLVDSLGPADRFAVMAFDNEPELPEINQAGLCPGSDRNRFAAVSFLGGVEARGGTEFEPAFERCFALLSAGGKQEARERVVVLVTDGQIGNEDHLLKRFAADLASVRLIALGIDQAVNEAVLMRLATPGGGWWACVESEDWLDAVLSEANRQVQPPVLSDLRISTGDGSACELAPQTPPDLAPGSAVQVLARVAGRPATVLVQGQRPDGSPWRQELPVRYLGDSALPKAWGRARVRDLEDRYAVTSDAGLEAQLVALSLGEGVLCRFTAFVAVDRVQVAGGGAPRTVVQPVEGVSGWAQEPEQAALAMGGMAPAAGASAGAPAQNAMPIMSLSAPAMPPSVAPAMPAPMPASMPGKPSGGPAHFGNSQMRSGSAKRKQASAADALGDAAQGAPITPRELLAPVLERWRAAGGDAVRRALVLRSAAVIEALSRLAELLADHASGKTLAERLQALLVRIRPPSGLSEVRGSIPDAEHLLSDLEQALSSDPQSAQAGTPAKGKPRFWT